MANRKSKEPLHRIFYLCSNFTPDIAWSNFLTECSFGKFPRGVKYEDGAIKCNRKKNSFVEYLPKDTEKAFEMIQEIFRDRLGIKTKKEKKSDMINFEKERQLLDIVEWKAVKHSSLRDTMVADFSNKFAMHNFLNEEEHYELILLLKLGLSSGLLTDDRIIINKGVIAGVVGLNFDYHTRELSLTGEIKRNVVAPSPIPVNYNIIKQENYDNNFLSLLSYHVEKTNRHISSVECM